MPSNADAVVQGVGEHVNLGFVPGRKLSVSQMYFSGEFWPSLIASILRACPSNPEIRR